MSHKIKNRKWTDMVSNHSMMSLGLKDSPFLAVKVAACQRGAIPPALVKTGLCAFCSSHLPASSQSRGRVNEIIHRECWKIWKQRPSISRSYSVTIPRPKNPAFSATVSECWESIIASVPNLPIPLIPTSFTWNLCSGQALSFHMGVFLSLAHTLSLLLAKPWPRHQFPQHCWLLHAEPDIWGGPQKPVFLWGCHLWPLALFISSFFHLDCIWVPVPMPSTVGWVGGTEERLYDSCSCVASSPAAAQVCLCSRYKTPNDQHD